MKQWIKASMAAVLSLTVVQAEATKLYEVESGKVSYEIKGSGNIMGSQMKSIGKKRLIFDRYGADMLTEENKIEKTSVMGQTQTNKSHTMVYLKEGVMYHVDFDHKKIVRMENPMTMMGGGNMTAKGKAMMEQMGGKKTGMDKVLGYSCEVWELMGTKQCIYKGISLKVESNIMGMKHMEVATKAEFGISVSKDDFKLPDFPLSNEMGASIDKNGLHKMDAQAIKDMKNAQAQLATMMGAMANATKDADVEKGQNPNAQQQEQIQNAMMSAMLPQMKQEFLGQEKVMRFLKKCLSNADTKKEANVCSDKANEMSGESEEDFGDEWNAQIKAESLKEIDHYLDVILPCVKRAQNAQTIQSCMQ